jgi:hypothetical protein
MTLLIGLITFALGCFITYYLDRSVKKTSGTSSIEVREELRRQRRTIQELQTNIISLLKIVVKTTVDTTAENLERGPLSPAEKTRICSSAYEAVKGRWLEESENLDLEGMLPDGDGARQSPEARIILPESLDIESETVRTEGRGRDAGLDFSVQSSEEASETKGEAETGESPESLEDLEPPPEDPELTTRLEDVAPPPNFKKDSSKEPGEDIEELEELE